MSANKSRLRSLDVFRGLTIAAMILVNYPGTWDYVFPPLEHAPWHGITPTDFIFPFFLFIVGVSISLAYSAKIDQGTRPQELYPKIISRTVKLFLLGIFLGLIPTFDFMNVRIAGVLQRIALVFLASSFLFLHTSWKKQVYIALGILLAYSLALTLLPMPGTGLVSLEPGQNIAAYVDRLLLPGKMWQGDWDPEGLLSTLPAIASGILGLLAGKILLSSLMPGKKALNLMSLGMLMIIAGLLWSLFFPLNKNLWSSSFVLVTSGAGFSVLGMLYYWLDMEGHQRGTFPWLVFGSNAIAVYVLADLLSLIFYSSGFWGLSLSETYMEAMMAAGIAPRLASMGYAILFVGINYLPAFWLYKRKIFIKL